MPSGALHRIIYMSTAVGVLRAEELDRIYLRAQAADARAGITGLMLFYEGVFLQVLEGPAAGVTSLLERIRRDRQIFQRDCARSPVRRTSAALVVRR